MRKAAPMARQSRNDDESYWDAITLLMPYSFAPAAQEAAHRYQMAIPEYCRRALLLRLAADGICLEDYDKAA